MDNRTVIGIGEVLLDIVFRNGCAEGSSVGGSVVNALVSLARSGIKTALVGAVGDDNVGRVILRFLEENNVNTEGVTVRKGAKTPHSIAFLDENGDADYSFYRTDEMLPDADEALLPRPNDIVLAGSFYAVDRKTHTLVSRLLRKAAESEAVSIYDLNFRPAHKKSLAAVRHAILENIEAADIMRCSREDLQMVFGMSDAQSVFNSEPSLRRKRVVCTAGGGAVLSFGREPSPRAYSVPEVRTVSAIGAGDNFNAGMIYGIVANGVTRQSLVNGTPDNVRNDIIANAIEFASNSCQQTYNYISPSFGEERKARLRSIF